MWNRVLNGLNWLLVGNLFFCAGELWLVCDRRSRTRHEHQFGAGYLVQPVDSSLSTGDRHFDGRGDRDRGAPVDIEQAGKPAILRTSNSIGLDSYLGCPWADKILCPAKN